MKTRVVYVVAVLALVLSLGGVGHAALIQFPSRAAFDAAHPPAVFEDFEEANVADGSWGFMDNPLDASTNNAVFSPGDIIDELRLSVGAAGPLNLIISSPGVGNYVSHAVTYDSGSTSKPEITIDILASDIMAVAMDLTSNPNGNNVDVELFSGAASLGIFTVNNVQGAGTFFGAWSDSDTITQVTLTGSADYFGVDNIALDTGVIPEPATLSLLGLGLLAAARRRKR